MNEIPTKSITSTSGSPSCRISTIWENQSEDFISLGESLCISAGNAKMIMFMGNHLLLYQFIFVYSSSGVRKHLSHEIKELPEAAPILGDQNIPFQPVAIIALSCFCSSK